MLAKINLTKFFSGLEFLTNSWLLKFSDVILCILTRLLYSSHSSPVRKLSKKRKAVIDDADDAVAGGDQGRSADDSFEIASLHGDSDDNDVCELMPIIFIIIFIIISLSH